MSRIGKQPIQIPDGVTVNITDRVLTAKSSKGELKVPYSQNVNVLNDGKTITVSLVTESKKNNALWGLTRALIYNAVRGVHNEWTKELEIHGVGYRAQLKGKRLDLQLGKSHPVEIEPPKGITFEVGQENIAGQNVQIVRIKGIDKQLVGDTAANIRCERPPEPYKGKGIRYRGEYVRRKAGKAAG
ncbi:MAG: 50S ribosomal protein L6 [Candidatus Latescibacteria bacterium]|nr:50S ribosomal protein L6 [Candidatus Latescibacterota bacterium]